MNRTKMGESSWDPQQYLRFERERTQPSVDLANRVRVKKVRRVLDLGCGPGNSTAILRARWPMAELVGVDRSEEMLHRARQGMPDVAWVCRDICEDLSDLGTFDVVFSNAVLQWLPDSRALLPGLFALLEPGGALAVQVPLAGGDDPMPSQQVLEKLAASERWQPVFVPEPHHPVYHEYPYFYSELSNLSNDIDMWKTDYVHIMNSTEEIVEWYKGSALRPYLDTLQDEGQKQEFLACYQQGINEVYRHQKNGKVLFPFARVFFTAYKNVDAK